MDGRRRTISSVKRLRKDKRENGKEGEEEGM